MAQTVQSEIIRTTVRIPAALWKRARAVQNGPRQTLQSLITEGLELRVAALEKAELETRLNADGKENTDAAKLA